MAPSRSRPTRGRTDQSAGRAATPPGRPLRIAHAYGNTRQRLKTALAAEIDAIEVDVWYAGRKVWVRHEARMRPFPLLVDKRMRGHSLPPWSMPLGSRWYVRLDVNRLRFDEVLETVAGTKRLLVDVKGSYHGRENQQFASALVGAVREHRAETTVAICGQYWPVLDDVRNEAPDLEVRYSVERVFQWGKFMHLVREDEPVTRVCIEHRFLNEERVGFLEEHGVNVYCWTVDDREEAARLAAAGADGIISNDLELLAELSGPVSRRDGE